MPQFRYKAVDALGKECSAEMEAPDESQAAQALTGKNLTVLELTVISGGKEGTGVRQVKPRFQSVKIPMGPVLELYEQISFLVGSGIPLYLSLRMLAESLKNPTLIRVVKRLVFELSEGQKLSQAMQHFPKCFPLLHCRLVAVGESTGDLPKVLSHLVDLVREMQEIKQRFWKAVAYPVFLVSISALLVFSLLVFVFPKFQQIFLSFHVTLPALTVALMDLGVFLKAHLGSFLLALGSIGGFLYLMATQDSFRMARDRWALKTPFVGDVYVSLFVSLLAKNLESLLKTGVTLIDALWICRDTLAPRGGLKYLFFSKLITATKEGELMSVVMQRSPLIPEMVWQLTAVGEKTGSLGTMMGNVFVYYKKRYIERLSRFASILGPGMMIVAAAIIAVTAASLFLPLFQLGSAIRKH